MLCKRDASIITSLLRIITSLLRRPLLLPNDNTHYYSFQNPKLADGMLEIILRIQAGLQHISLPKQTAQ